MMPLKSSFVILVIEIFSKQPKQQFNVSFNVSKIAVLLNSFEILWCLHFQIYVSCYYGMQIPLANKHVHCLKVMGNSGILQARDTGAKFTEEENYGFDACV